MSDVEALALPWIPVLGRGAGPRAAQVRRGLEAGAPLLLGDPDRDLAEVELDEPWPLLAGVEPPDGAAAARWAERGVVGALLAADPARGTSLDDAAARAQPLPLVLDRRAPDDPVRADDLRAALRRLGPRLAGVALPDAGEETLLALRDLEDDLALLVPGREAASGWRLGAAGCVAPEAWLDPDGFLEWVASFEEDLGAALALERRLARLLEVRLEPLVRRAGRDPRDTWRALLLAGGGRALAGVGSPWEDLAPELEALGAEARALFAGAGGEA